MAIRAIEIAAVIERLVGQADMTVIGRSPCNRVVAYAAVLRRAEMAGILAGRQHTVVTR